MGGGDKGILCSEEKTFTLSTVDNMRICMEEEGSITPWDVQSRRIFPDEGKWPSLYSGEGGGHGYVRILRNTNMESNTVVRRLTPTECERLQGFPDNYTNIPWANKATAPDSRRYKALGNSMAVPVMLWIGKRMMDAKEVVYDAEAIRKVMLPSLSHDEIKTGQQMLFYELS
jgi:hypothetical protein